MFDVACKIVSAKMLRMLLCSVLFYSLFTCVRLQRNSQVLQKDATETAPTKMMMVCLRAVAAVATVTETLHLLQTFILSCTILLVPKAVITFANLPISSSTVSIN